jgi:hypothetical protein
MTASLKAGAPTPVASKASPSAVWQGLAAIPSPPVASRGMAPGKPSKVLVAVVVSVLAVGAAVAVWARSSGTDATQFVHTIVKSCGVDPSTHMRTIYATVSVDEPTSVNVEVGTREYGSTAISIGTQTMIDLRPGQQYTAIVSKGNQVLGSPLNDCYARVTDAQR